ncbi:MAG: hypothetical protein R2774_06305 [Saprospiraceae bacterium]
MKSFIVLILLCSTGAMSCSEDKEVIQDNKIVGVWKYLDERVKKTFPNDSILNNDYTIYCSEDGFFEFKNDGTFISKFVKKSDPSFIHDEHGNYSIVGDSITLTYISTSGKYILVAEILFESEEILTFFTKNNNYIKNNEIGTYEYWIHLSR